ncbi:hypothetical protein OG863_39605 [Streptomyces decoyicus]|uniref:Uncharacterized protein n=1 Tax=Streptomyces decoyicus TaxID=249567 RepID=A0ABZ1FUC7_9ACTN|nr:hypothetical protein [Streptomyces decoyicus]WSB73563.1 hypothetical protein OG863_39605 [Streptomyces decoyicus]
MRDIRRSEQPEPTEHYIFQDSRTVVLECGFPWNSVPDRDPLVLERITAHRAVRALAELCEGLIRPMTFGVTGNWVDEYGWPAVGNPPRWNWFLKTPQSPSDARSPYVDPQVMETATLDERSMLAAVDRLLDDPCEAPEGRHLAWAEIFMGHTWARLSDADRHIENNTLRIDDHDNKVRRVRVPLERADGHFWVTAPETGGWYPFQLRVDKSCGTVYPDGREHDEFIELTIDVNWSFWWHSGGGRSRLDQAVGRLLRQGWRYANPQPSPEPAPGA